MNMELSKTLMNKQLSNCDACVSDLSRTPHAATVWTMEATGTGPHLEKRTKGEQVAALVGTWGGGTWV